MQRPLVVASPFCKNRSCSSRCGSDPGPNDDDERTALVTAVVADFNAGGNAASPTSRGNSPAPHGDRVEAALPSPADEAEWVTAQRSVRPPAAGRRHVGGADGCKNSRTAGGGEGKQQHRSVEVSLSRMSARRPMFMSCTGNNQGTRAQAPEAGDRSAAARGFISQLYDALAADKNDTMEDSGAANWKVPSAQKAADARARVQQLLRTSRVHMKKRSGERSWGPIRQVW